MKKEYKYLLIGGGILVVAYFIMNRRKYGLLGGNLLPCSNPDSDCFMVRS